LLQPPFVVSLPQPQPPRLLLSPETSLFDIDSGQPMLKGWTTASLGSRWSIPFPFHTKQDDKGGVLPCDTTETDKHLH
jgi:hypothetical protein